MEDGMAPGSSPLRLAPVEAPGRGNSEAEMPSRPCAVTGLVREVRTMRPNDRPSVHPTTCPTGTGRMRRILRPSVPGPS